LEFSGKRHTLHLRTYIRTRGHLQWRSLTWEVGHRTNKNESNEALKSHVAVTCPVTIIVFRCFRGNKKIKILKIVAIHFTQKQRNRNRETETEHGMAHTGWVQQNKTRDINSTQEGFPFLTVLFLFPPRISTKTDLLSCTNHY